MDEFPGNSQRAKENPINAPKAKDEPEVNKIISGDVRRRKKPLGKRFAETFTGTDSRGVLEYVLLDVAMPAIKDLIYDMFSQGMERKLFGESRAHSRRGRSSAPPQSRTPYGSYSYQGSQPAQQRPDPREPRRTRSSRPNSFDDILIPTRVEALDVIDNMFELISQYQVATVANLYGFVGEPVNAVDNDFGWYDLRGAKVIRTRDGYLLDLPRPIPLD